MKKIYTQPEWQLVNFIAEDVITSSGDVDQKLNSDLFENGNLDNWDWN